MPWEWLWHGEQYANHFIGPERAFRYWDGWLPYLSNEPLWNLFAAATTPIADTIGWRNWVRLLSFFSLLIISYYILSSSPSRYWAIALLLITSPLILNNYISGVRQTLAISLFLLALMSPRFIATPTVFATPLIHSTFFFTLPFYFLALTEIISLKTKIVIVVAASISLILLVPVIADLLGARQADRRNLEIELMIRPLWLYLVVVAMIFFLSGRNFIKEHQVATFGIMFYLVTLPLGGAGVSPRVIENFFPLIFISFSYLRGFGLYIIFLASLPAIAFLWMRGITTPSPELFGF